METIQQFLKNLLGSIIHNGNNDTWIEQNTARPEPKNNYFDKSTNQVKQQIITIKKTEREIAKFEKKLNDLNRTIINIQKGYREVL